MHDLDLMITSQLQGDHKKAREISDKLESLGPDKILNANGENDFDTWIRHSFNRGWFLLQEGNYKVGSKLLEAGRLINVYGSPKLETDKPLFNPETHSIKDNIILLRSEGGLGDEIVSARFATDFKSKGAKKVIIFGSPSLASIFSRIEGVDEYVSSIDDVDFDYWVPGFSAGWVLDHSFDTIKSSAYLSASGNYITKWRDKLSSDKIKIGIRWAGNPLFEHQQFRKFPEKFLTNLSSIPEVQLYSLQRDANLRELPSEIIDLQDDLETWEDTAAVIEQLDLVITSCTSIAHLAGALGKETWVIVPILPYHTWAYGAPESTSSPYYDSVKIYRQTKFSYWSEVFTTLYKDLQTKFNLNEIVLPNEDIEYKRLNIGCGLKRADGAINIDKEPRFKPDLVLDLTTTPWPFKESTVSTILADKILHQIGDNTEDFIRILQEMYRVSVDGALWRIITPHWNNDFTFANPLNKRIVSNNTMLLFDRKFIFDSILAQVYIEPLGFLYDIDLELVSSNLVYTSLGEDIIKANKDPSAMKTVNFHLSNTVQEIEIVVQVHKDPRISNKQFFDGVQDGKPILQSN